MRELAEIMSHEELFSLPLEIQQAIANQRLEGLELPREVILDSLRQIRGEVSIEELIRKYKTRYDESAKDPYVDEETTLPFPVRWSAP